jgi:hypothetical protein
MSSTTILDDLFLDCRISDAGGELLQPLAPALQAQVQPTPRTPAAGSEAFIRHCV